MPRYLTQPVKETGASSAADTQETKHVGKAGRPGSYLGSWTGETGGCAGLDGHGMEQEEHFVSTFMPCFHKTTTSELTLARQQKFAPNW